MRVRRFADHRKLRDGWRPCTFMLQKPSLAFDAAAIASERATRSDDAVTGNDDSDGIGAVGETDCAHCSGAADAARELAVGDGGAERNLSQSLPYLTLKGRAVSFDRQVVDGGEVSGEIAADGFGETVGVAGSGEGESNSSVGTVVKTEE